MIIGTQHMPPFRQVMLTAIACSGYYGSIGTPDELNSLFADEDFAIGECFRLVELELGYLDAPISLRLATAAVEESNKKKVVDGSIGG